MIRFVLIYIIYLFIVDWLFFVKTFMCFFFIYLFIIIIIFNACDACYVMRAYAHTLPVQVAE